MSVPTSSPTKNTTKIPLALSSLHIQLEALEKEHQWLLKQIKRKRTELNNFVAQIRSTATEVFHRSTSIFNKLAEIDREIHALFDEILATRKFSLKNKKDIERVYRRLQMAGMISSKFLSEEENTFHEFVDEENDLGDQSQKHSQKHTHDYTQQQEITSPSASKADSSRKIRQTFLRLAEIFHPDKVVDSDIQMRYTEIMKEINQAYQEGDLARLLEIEKQHQVGEISSNTEDGLTRKVARLEQQNELLKTQYEDLKRELREVKQTPEGAMVSDYRKAKRARIDPISQMLAQAESEVKIISSIRDFVKTFKEKKITIKEFIAGPEVMHSLSQEIVEDLLNQMFDDLMR